MSLINFDQLVEFNDGIEGNVSLELDTRTSLENVTITKDDQGVISTDRTAEQTLNFLETEVAPTSPEDASMLASTIEDLKTRVDEEVAQQNNESPVAVSTADQTEVSGDSQQTEFDWINSAGRSVPFPPGAIPVDPAPASVNINTINGDTANQDMRVKIRVPENYYDSWLTDVLKDFKGIIFPYTPQIGIEHKADYSTMNPIHSNFAIYFYQRSSVTPINISGKFTVANEKEAEILVATIHLLRSLTKMRFGGATGDPDSGAPPPVCRLDAYGAFMLQNVPVVISSFKIDLPDNVDYYTLGKKSNSQTFRKYEMTAVPVVSTISVSCIPMYSRNEMQKFNVTQWLKSKSIRKAGYL